MKKIVLFSSLVLVWIVVLFPKTLIWNYFVDEMQKRDISVVAKEVDMKLWVLYNEIDIRELVVLKSFKADTLSLKHTLLSPLLVEFEGESEFGDFEGVVGLRDKNGSIVFKDTDLDGAMFRSYFKKHKEGMKYEFAF